MIIPSNKKIEHKALNALESIIDEHSTMDYEFNANDTEMSWDGAIWLFKENNGDQSKKNLDGRVPVQIKGHNDPKRKYIDKYRITYRVEIDDLKAYATEKGVIYFQIFLDGNRAETFYSSLYPSKIADYLERVEKKKKPNKKTINIPFVRLEQSPEKLYYIAKQFHDESILQGSSYTPLVKDRIRNADFNKIQSISVTVVGASNPYEALLRLPSGDICFHGKLEGDKYDRPLEWLDNAKFYIGNDIVKPISINGEVFYNRFRSVADSDKNITLQLSPNLEIILRGRIIRFNMLSDFSVLNNDAIFLLKLQECAYFNVGDVRISFPMPPFSTEFQNRLNFIIDAYKVTEEIQIELNEPFRNYTEDDLRQIMLLINLRRGNHLEKYEDGYKKYTCTLRGKYVPLLVNKAKDSIVLINSVYSQRLAVFLPAEDDSSMGYRLPLFTNQEAEVLGNLYKYDFDEFQKQINESDINEKTAFAMLECVLLLIKVFDCCNDYRFLDLAEYLLSKTEPFGEPEISLLRCLQIKKRRNIFTDADIELLKHLQSSDALVLYEKSVLLHDPIAEEYFNQLSDTEKDFYRDSLFHKQDKGLIKEK